MTGYRGRFSLLLIMVLLLSVCGPALAVGPTPLAVDQDSQVTFVDAGLSWLLTQQADDGSFPSDFDSYSVTLDAALAGVAAGSELSAWRTAPGNPSTLDYLLNNRLTLASSVGKMAKLALVLVGAGLDPEAATGVDLVALLPLVTDGNGQIGTGISDHTWVMLALAAMRASIPEQAVTQLLSVQDASGGWDSGFGLDSNTTALALQALMAAGVSAGAPEIALSLDYLSSQQANTGGFVYNSDFGGVADPASTANCLQALVAAGENPYASHWLKGGRSALDDLAEMQLPDGGLPGYLGTSDILATAQSLPAMLGRALPYSGTAPALRDAVAYLKGIQAANGSVAEGNSARALISLATVGVDGGAWRVAGGPSLVDYVEASGPRARSAGDLGRTALALAMAGGNPYHAAGRNLVADALALYNAETGAFDDNGYLTNDMLAVQALVASGATVPEGAITYLVEQQNADGGWGWAGGQDSDSNSTALAVQALVAFGLPPSDPTLAEALSYFRGIQLADGGFSFAPRFGDASDGDSSGLSLQALNALGIVPSRGWDWAKTLSGSDQITVTVSKPMDFVLDLQVADGSFDWQPGIAGYGEMSTLDILPTLVGAVYPEPSPQLVAALDAVDWLKEQQLANGSYPASFGHPAGLTLDVLFAGLSMGQAADDWSQGSGSTTLLGYLASVVDEYAVTAGATGKLLAGVVAADANPTAFGGVDLVALLRGFQGEAGQYGTTLGDQAWAMLGLAAAGIPVATPTSYQLMAMQNDDGGWGWMAGEASDTNSTAVAVQALAAAGVSRDEASLLNALAYLQTQQSAAGFGYGSDSPADASSTANVLQALAAAGQSPYSDPWVVEAQNPVAALTAMQSATGAFPGWDGSDDLTSTAQAVPGLLLEAQPLAGGYWGYTQWLPTVSMQVGR